MEYRGRVYALTDDLFHREEDMRGSSYDKIDCMICGKENVYKAYEHIMDNHEFFNCDEGIISLQRVMR